MTEAVRVVLVDDHVMVLDAMRDTLRRRDGIEVVATAASLREAIDVIDAVDADVIVTDFDLGDGVGTDVVRRAAAHDPPIPVLLITGTDQRRGVQAALHAGCAGFVGKAEGMDQLVMAIVAVARGAAVFPAALLSATMDEVQSVPDGSLTPRELEILRLLATARSAPEIADELFLSHHTVRNHVKQILTKLGAHSQLQAVVTAVRLGYVAID